ncbi:MAG: thiamine phosphate synthase [Luteolibacter sp.]
MSDPLLYCILDLGYTLEENAVSVTASLLAGGADMLQLRAKNHDLATIRRVAEKLLPLCRAAGIPFILNDHPALAADIGADGVHLGQDDGSLADAERLLERGIHPGLHSFIHPSSSSLRHKFLIGRSTHSLAQARAALAEGFDYIGFGPLFPTPTKAGRPAIGLEEVAIMENEVGAKIPAFCIGGITPATLPQVLSAGARRIVVVSALLQAPDVEAATRAVKIVLDKR